MITSLQDLTNIYNTRHEFGYKYIAFINTTNYASEDFYAKQNHYKSVYLTGVIDGEKMYSFEYWDLMEQLEKKYNSDSNLNIVNSINKIYCDIPVTQYPINVVFGWN
jgi:hypothetical protein